MFKKTFGVLLLLIICSTISFAQNANQQTVTQWEYLEVSSEFFTNGQNGNYLARTYKYLNSELFFTVESPLDWVGKASWELVGIGSHESSSSNSYSDTLYFKRVYDKERTEKEISYLREREKNASAKVPTPTEFDLSDLDVIESNQNLANFNRSEEEKFRNALQQIKDLPIKVLNIKSNSQKVGVNSLYGELTVDATQILLKDDNKYRSSEANKYLQEAIVKIRNSVSVSFEGTAFRVSIVVSYKGRQNIVAQKVLYNFQ